ncbi:hypothetical protein AGMMS50230_11530 [Spirochaetia bacterium]|nr:hypothetical protein AGMMS50230_11530 [Spirochaetia bacterium]
MMDLVTVGNFFTLGISLLAILVFRYMDRQNRSVDLAREYGKRLKDDIAAFAEQKAAEVKDNGLVLDVQKSAVKEALNRLGEVNGEFEAKSEGLSRRLEEVGRIGERISAYDKSMEELIRMTAYVEENMKRLRDESAFVEETAKKIGGLKHQAEELEKDLGGLELRFEEENTAALEKAAETLVGRVEGSVEDLRAAAETVERQVEEHRQAVDRIEAERKSRLERDVEIINKTLAEAVERAGSKSDKLEEAALVKLREESMVRLHRFQGTVEEKFQEYHENAKAKVAEIQAMVKSCRDEWKSEHEELAETELRILAGADERLLHYREDQASQWKRIETMADDALKLDSQLRLAMETAEERVRRDFGLFEEEQKQEREKAAASLAESAEALRAEMTALEQEITVLKNRAYDNMSEKLQLFEDDFFADLAKRSTEIDSRLTEWHTNLDRKLVALGEEAEQERRNLEITFKDEVNARIGEQSGRILSDLERLKLKADAFEEKIQNGLDETESRVSQLSSGADEIRRELKEFTSQSRLFEKTDELRSSLERNMEALRSDLSGIEERRAEAARLETEFIKVRRLEDEVNAKMTRFLTEKSHLDIMEKDFEKLIQTSARVEERLKDVFNADDTLQDVQVSLRKLEDAMAAAEEKYQRVENKNRILEETNRGIERNFQLLEETEMALRKCRDNIDHTEDELDTLRPSIDELAAASEKARETGEQLGVLDTNLKTIEERIEKMQTAREWLARTETRFEELNREAQEELKLLEAVLKEDRKKSGGGDGAPPIAARENVIRLARQGWGAEEIARSLKIGRGEVELILEMGSSTENTRGSKK